MKSQNKNDAAFEYDNASKAGLKSLPAHLAGLILSVLFSGLLLW